MGDQTTHHVVWIFWSQKCTIYCSSQSLPTQREKEKEKSNSKAHVVMVSLNCQKIEVKMAEAALENGVFCCIKYFLISFEVVNIYQGQYPPPH